MALELLFLNLLAVTGFLISFSLVLRVWKQSKRVQKLPPGPKKLPIIGNMHQLVGFLPHRRLKDLAKIYGPLMHLQLGEVPAIVVSSPETAKEIMKSHDVAFSQRPFVLALNMIGYNCMDIAMAPYGAYWRQLRKICILELLTAKRVKSFRAVREEEAFNLVSLISSSEGSGVNLSTMLFSSSCNYTTKAAFGKKSKDQDVLLHSVEKVLALAAGFSISDLFPSAKWLGKISGMQNELEKLMHHVDSIIENILAEHRNKQDLNATSNNSIDDEETFDFADVLLNLQSQNNLEIPLSNTHIKAVILDIITGGSETASTTLEWAMTELIKDSRVLERAQEEVRQVFDQNGKVDEAYLNKLEYLNLVIKETLRLHPALALIPRECREECKINGYDIPLGTRVVVNAWAIGRDPKYWIEPDKFYPERFIDSSIDYKGNDFMFLPFGAGRRMCPGMLFGMANVQIILAALLYYFDWKLPVDLKNKELDMEEISGLTLKRKNPLHLVPIPRRPLLV